MNNAKAIRLGIGNGSLAAPVCQLLGYVGVKCDPSARTAWQKTGNKLVPNIFISRPQHLVEALCGGIIDCAILGQDLLAEYQSSTDELVVLRQLPISKTTLTDNTRVVAFVPEKSSYRDISDLQDAGILSEYPRLTKRWLAKKGIEANIVHSSGGTESMVATGRYDCGVGVTETGASLRANQLRVLSIIMNAPVVVAVRKKQATETNMICLAAMLAGVHEARDYVLIKFNVAQSALPRIVDILPALRSPTIHKLQDNTSVAVETVVSINELAVLIVNIRLAGADGIIWHDLDGLMRH